MTVLRQPRRRISKNKVSKAKLKSGAGEIVQNLDGDKAGTVGKRSGGMMNRAGREGKNWLPFGRERQGRQIQVGEQPFWGFQPAV